MENAYCQALKVAYEFEQNGEIFYRKLIDKVSDPFAKKVLSLLADEELEHLRKIEGFNNYLLGNGEFDFETECQIALPDRIKALVQEKLKDGDKTITSESNDVEVYEMAMEMERRGYEIYSQFLNENQDQKLERFLDFLVGEEKEHYDLLAYSKRYLVDPAYYFEEYGGWIFV